MDKQIKKALELFDQQDYKGAIEICDSLLFKNFDINVLLLKGKCLQNLQLSSEAERIYLEVIKYDLGNYLANYELGNFCYGRGNYTKAIDFYRQASQTNSNDSDVLNNLGLCYLHQGEYDKALDWYRKAFTIKPQDADILNNIAMAYQYKSDFQNALKYFNLALDITPTDQDILQKRDITLKKINHNKS